MDLAEKIFQFIKTNNLIKNGDILLVGVSGGADSVALLEVLYKLKFKLAVNLHVIHFNHRLRANSDKDEAFVKSLANKLNLPCHVGRRSVSGRSKLVSEDTARQWRFRFFLKVAKKTGSTSVVLAHTQNDLAETVLMRILRGAGLSGLRGILHEHQMGQMKIIRPFLGVSRKEIEEYLNFHKLKFRIDETNQQIHYLRNKIRLKLLPFLIKEYNTNLPEILIDLAQASGADYDYLYNTAKRILEDKAKINNRNVRIKLNIFLKQPVSMRRMFLRLAFEHLVGDLSQLSFKHIQEVESLILSKSIGAEVSWPKSIRVRKIKDGLDLHRVKL